MSDIDHDDGFDEAFKGFGDDEAPATPPVADPATPPAEPPKEDPKPAEEPKKDDQTPAEPPKKEEEGTTPTGDAPKKEEDPKKPETPEAPATPPAPEEQPKPLTLDDIKGVINEVRTEERMSSQVIETATNEVLEAFYPQGLSNTLVDQNTGKELKTPQDVIDATGGQMSADEAAQWLLNEQYKLDQEINRIKTDAKSIAETTLKFKQDGVDVLTRYEPLFKAYPQLQTKVWNQYIKLVKADKDKGVILSAPDMREFYDTVLEPYQKAYEFSTQQPATNPTTPATQAPATPGAEDRLDEGGDGGATPPDDPNDFAQQVKKELAKGF